MLSQNKQYLLSDTVLAEFERDGDELHLNAITNHAAGIDPIVFELRSGAWDFVVRQSGENECDTIPICPDDLDDPTVFFTEECTGPKPFDEYWTVKSNAQGPVGNNSLQLELTGGYPSNRLTATWTGTFEFPPGSTQLYDFTVRARWIVVDGQPFVQGKIEVDIDAPSTAEFYLSEVNFPKVRMKEIGHELGHTNSLVLPIGEGQLLRDPIANVGGCEK